VNYLEAQGAATGFGATLRTQGSDANVSMTLITKGTGNYAFFTNSNAPQFVVAHTASAVNYLQVTGNTAGSFPYIAATGSDTNVAFGYYAKGTGSHFFHTNNAVQFQIANTTSAVNYLQATGNSAGLYPSLTATGSDANVGFVYNTKGGALHQFYTGNQPQFFIAHTASTVNYLQVTGAPTGSGGSLSGQGSDANVGVDIVAKGSGSVRFFTGSYAANQCNISHTASTVNILALTGGATGNAPTLSVGGSDTNIDLALTPKGTGNVRFGTHTGTADVAITGYIEVKDSAGNVRKLAVIS
jgi:hypothetical protein